MRNTKKAKIIEYARKDPFLKIEDLAQQAETTPRYVRTILSEANLSLMKLRKEYAKRIENRNNQIYDRLLFNYILDISFQNNISPQETLIYNNPQDFNVLPGNIKQSYFHYSFLNELNGKPWCANTVIINKDFLESEDSLSFEETVKLLSQLLKEKDTFLSNIRIKIELSSNQVGDLLEMPQLSPLFKIEQTVKLDSKNVLLMLAYFNSENISLSFSVNEGLIINRKNM